MDVLTTGWENWQKFRTQTLNYDKVMKVYDWEDAGKIKLDGWQSRENQNELEQLIKQLDLRGLFFKYRKVAKFMWGIFLGNIIGKVKRSIPVVMSNWY